jgi:hypothetical protein
MNHKKYHISFLLLSALILSATVVFSSPRPKKKLLLYAAINDSVVLHINDTSRFNEMFCIQLNIDTINTEEIKYTHKRNFRNGFFYKGHFYLKHQLFMLGESPAVNEVKLLSNSVIGIYIEPAISDSNCLTRCQKVVIKNSWVYYHRENKHCTIYIEKIIAQIKEAEPMNLNSILLIIE